jgi:plasmid replication initiation protein
MSNLPAQRSKEFLLFQPNALTSARYRYSAIAKNVIYAMMDMVQKYQTHEKEAQRDLFQNVVVTLDISKIDKNRHPADVWKAIYEELMKRPINYTYIDKDGVTVDVATVLVPTMSKKRGSNEIVIKLIPESIDILLFLGKGFTAFSKTVALALPSIYSKRLYELCCRFRDTGFYRAKIAEFRQLMNCEDKFRQIGQLREKVIERGISDINETSELYVSYTLVKGRRVGRTPAKVEQIMFFINPKTTDRQYYWDDYKNVFNFLANVYGDSAAMAVADWLMDNKRIVAVSERITRLKQDVADDKVAKAGLHNYLLLLLADYEIPENLLPLKKEKKGKKL